MGTGNHFDAIGRSRFIHAGVMGKSEEKVRAVLCTWLHLVSLTASVPLALLVASSNSYNGFKQDLRFACGLHSIWKAESLQRIS